MSGKLEFQDDVLYKQGAKLKFKIYSLALSAEDPCTTLLSDFRICSVQNLPTSLDDVRPVGSRLLNYLLSRLLRSLTPVVVFAAQNGWVDSLFQGMLFGFDTGGMKTEQCDSSLSTVLSTDTHADQPHDIQNNQLLTFTTIANTLVSTVKCSTRSCRIEKWSDGGSQNSFYYKVHALVSLKLGTSSPSTETIL
eukprot:scaffold6834_cov83-Cylindrotheca_fusiformis.AAC.2